MWTHVGLKPTASSDSPQPQPGHPSKGVTWLGWSGFVFGRLKVGAGTLTPPSSGTRRFDRQASGLPKANLKRHLLVLWRCAQQSKVRWSERAAPSSRETEALTIVDFRVTVCDGGPLEETATCSPRQY